MDSHAAAQAATEPAPSRTPGDGVASVEQARFEMLQIAQHAGGVAQLTFNLRLDRAVDRRTTGRGVEINLQMPGLLIGEVGHQAGLAAEETQPHHGHGWMHQSVGPQNAGNRPARESAG